MWPKRLPIVIVLICALIERATGLDGTLLEPATGWSAGRCKVVGTNASVEALLLELGFGGLVHLPALARMHPALEHAERIAGFLHIAF